MLIYVDVVIPSGPDRAFTYSVPDDLGTMAVVGCRVLVPFGRKYTIGVVVDRPTSTLVTSVKPIADVLDGTPSFTASLLALCRWVAEYYMAPLNEVLRAALPHGFGGTSKRRVRTAVPANDPRMIEMKRKAPRRFTLVQHLIDHGPTLTADLKRITGFKSIHSVVSALEREGMVTSEEVLPRPKTRPRERDIIDLTAIDAAVIQQQIAQMPARRAKAREFLSGVLRAHAQGQTSVDLLQLLKQCGASSAVSAPFRESGVVTIVRREVPRTQDFGTEAQTLTITLNPAQQQVVGTACGALDEHCPRTFLLHGVTGSGKTQVYIECIRHCLSVGRSAIVLVPEISLTPQIVRRFKSHFGDSVQVVHSRMTPGERSDVWRLAREGKCTVVIGPRSALFAPLRDVGLIVVDEEHESSYKQFDATPRYHARDVAIMRGQQEKAIVLLGSATPSLESYANALSGKFGLLEMPDRVDHAGLPDIRIVDMTAERRSLYGQLKTSLPPDERDRLRHFQQPALSRLLRDQIELRLKKREGVILLQNRRGFAPFVSCPDCGFVAMCDDCQVSLTFHLSKRHLRCHYCGHVRAPYTVCPTCGSPEISLHGMGTQRVEEELAQTFPGVRVVRMDLDTTSRKGAHDRLLRKFGDKEADILLGTQMVAKGLDFPHVTLVGVISADTQMLLPDFRSSERTFQLLTQVAGRAGRSHLHGEVVIQTAQPDHRTLVHILDHDYRGFFDEELAARLELHYPPYSRLTLVEVKGGDDNKVRTLAEQIASRLRQLQGPYEVLGPAPAVIGKIKKMFRWHLVVRTPKAQDPSGAQTRGHLQTAIGILPPNRRDLQVIVDVDPVGLM
jgi:primosomal protein N' (replication factor Y) (superfamily II helicase)